jgi:hypothetical protein
MPNGPSQLTLYKRSLQGVVPPGMFGAIYLELYAYKR